MDGKNPSQGKVPQQGRNLLEVQHTIPMSPQQGLRGGGMRNMKVGVAEVFERNIIRL